MNSNRRILGIIMFIMAFGYWFFIRTHFLEFDRLSAQERTLKAAFEKKQSQLYDLSAFQRQLETMQKRFDSLLQQLSEKNEMPELLEDISKTGRDLGLKFKLFAPQPEVMHDFYVELPLKISLVGTYVQLALFISQIAQMSRIVTLHDFSIEGMSSGDELLMHVTAKIYQYKAS